MSERLEDIFIDGYKIFQDDELYCFTSDSVLLSKFATVKNNDIVADFCSGSGIVGLNLFALNKCVKSVTLFEMQKPLFDLSVKTVEYNNLQNKIFPVNCKIQDIPTEYNEKFSLIVCNPPYMEKERGEKAVNKSVAICKCEIELTLKELIVCANKYLKYGGRFAMCNRADRLADIIYLMKQNNIEPKKLQFVKGANKTPYLVLIEGVKGGKSGIKILSEKEN